MSLEIASHRVTQRHGGAEPDQDGAKATTYALRKVANASPDPRHIQTGHAERARGQHVDTPVPAMKGGKAIPDLRNQLRRSGEHDDDGRSNVHDDGEIAHTIAGDITMSYKLTPSVEVPPQRRKAIERRYSKREHQLADDDHHKPKAGGCFQRGVRKRG